MSRIKPFLVQVEVTNELLQQGDREWVEASVGDQLEGTLSRPLTGPRGGRYEPIGDIEYLGSSDQADDAWIRNVRTFAARRNGRYVRPKRGKP